MKRNYLLSILFSLGLFATPALAFAGSAAFTTCSDFSVGSGTPHWTCTSASLHATNVYSNGNVLHGIFTDGKAYTVTGSYSGTDNLLYVGICAADQNSTPADRVNVSSSGSFSFTITPSECASGYNALIFNSADVIDPTSGVITSIAVSWVDPPPTNSIQHVMDTATSGVASLIGFDTSDVPRWMFSKLLLPITGGSLALLYVLRFPLIALMLISIITFFAFKAWKVWRRA